MEMRTYYICWTYKGGRWEKWGKTGVKRVKALTKKEALQEAAKAASMELFNDTMFAGGFELSESQPSN
jgi:hypothetical protein